MRVIERHHVGAGGSDHKSWITEVGMPWSEQEFFEDALQQRQSMEVQAHLPDRAKFATISIPTDGVYKRSEQANRNLDKFEEARGEFVP